MSEYRRYCPVCDEKTVHDHWKNTPMGDRANLAERAFMFGMTLGISELVADAYCQCLRCGTTRRLA